jgi:hypothetical protein
MHLSNIYLETGRDGVVPELVIVKVRTYVPMYTRIYVCMHACMHAKTREGRREKARYPSPSQLARRPTLLSKYIHACAIPELFIIGALDWRRRSGSLCRGGTEGRVKRRR